MQELWATTCHLSQPRITTINAVSNNEQHLCSRAPENSK